MAFQPFALTAGPGTSVQLRKGQKYYVIGQEPNPLITQVLFLVPRGGGGSTPLGISISSGTAIPVDGTVTEIAYFSGIGSPPVCLPVLDGTPLTATTNAVTQKSAPAVSHQALSGLGSVGKLAPTSMSKTGDEFLVVVTVGTALTAPDVVQLVTNPGGDVVWSITLPAGFTGTVAVRLVAGNDLENVTVELSDGNALATVGLSLTVYYMS